MNQTDPEISSGSVWFYPDKHCNIQYKSLGVEGFVEITRVRECRIENDSGFWRGRRVWLGLDLSISEDNTAVATVTEADGILYAKVWGFIPSDKIDRKSKSEHLDYNSLIKSGVCFDCGDDAVDYSEIEKFILDMESSIGVEIVQIGYDRYNAMSTVQKLEAAGYECVEIKQHSSVLHAPTKLLKEYILHKTFRYENNLLLEVNFQNARCTYDTNMNRYVNKKKSAGKVDCVVAIINALYLLQQDMLNSSGWGAQIA